MSEKRFLHTLGAERLAAKLGELVMPGKVYELRCAALLHDVAKEIPREENQELIAKVSHELTGEDLKSPQIFHAFVAPEIIKRDFPEHATPDVLSAVFNHTTGAPDMSLFDCIIFISDFAEEGRSYPACREIARRLADACNESLSQDERVSGIYRITYQTLLSVRETLLRLGEKINPRTLLTISSFAAKI